MDGSEIIITSHGCEILIIIQMIIKKQYFDIVLIVAP